MGNSVSQRDFQCIACNDLFEIHELFHLCPHDYRYIDTLLKGDSLRAKSWSKKQIIAFILFISFGSYYFGRSYYQLLDEFQESQLKIRTLANTGKDFYFGHFISGPFLNK